MQPLLYKIICIYIIVEFSHKIGAYFTVLHRAPDFAGSALRRRYATRGAG
jgi:hypothetical protein